MSSSLEVVMRPPEVVVRELSPEEGAQLKQISKRARYQSNRQRAVILLASSTGMPSSQIAAAVRSDESHVRKVIDAFNERGCASLDPNHRGGRPSKTTPEQRDRIVSVARARPDTQGVALTRWSLPKLAVHLAGMGVGVSAELAIHFAPPIPRLR
jgi:transposase